jgi:hypothetical protein
MFIIIIIIIIMMIIINTPPSKQHCYNNNNDTDNNSFISILLRVRVRVRVSAARTPSGCKSGDIKRTIIKIKNKAAGAWGAAAAARRGMSVHLVYPYITCTDKTGAWLREH